MVKKTKEEKQAEKRARVTQKNKRKAKSKADKEARRDKELYGEDQDIDEILAQYKAEQDAVMQVSEDVIESHPSRRVNGSIFANANKPQELFLFGGEYFNGTVITFYNDLFLYDTNKNQWRKISSRNSPLPRSSQQIAIHSSGTVYMFGGEFASPRQNTFYHYSDFWSFSPQERAWSRIDGKGMTSPCARSGHRMISWRNFIVLFGGFVDTSSQTKYLNDLWVFDLDTYQWQEVKLPATASRPDPRSGCIFVHSKDTAVLIGGYSKLKTGRNSTRGIVHTDYWTLHLSPQLREWKWERRKRAANAPGPRVGMTAVMHKGRAIVFGGVHDLIDTEETLESEFYNDLLALNLETNRWHSLKLRPSKSSHAKRKQTQPSNNAHVSNQLDELLANERFIRGLAGEESNTQGDNEQEKDEEEAILTNEKLESQFQRSVQLPHPRFNAALAITRDRLWIYSGLFESKIREYTLDSLHTIDLGKLDGCTTIWEQRIQEDADWQESEDEEGEDESGDDASENDGEALAYDIKEHLVMDDSVALGDQALRTFDDEDEETPESGETDVGEEDPMIPKPFETLREYFNRLGNMWIERVMQTPRSASDEMPRGKELRRIAFNQAETHYWSVREEVRELEIRMEDAGMGEVVEKSVAEQGENRRMGMRR